MSSDVLRSQLKLASQQPWPRGAPRRCLRRSDQGFMLIEVLVAMVLLGIVVSAGLGLGVRAMQSSTALSERQGAVFLAGQALDQVRAVNPTLTSSGISGLVVGRKAADVTSQWSSIASTDKASTWSASDPNAAGSPVVPLTVSQELAGHTFTVDTLIGTCYRSRADTSDNCSKHPVGVGVEPTADTSLVRLVRVAAVVRWTPPGRAMQNTFVASELLDPAPDLVWNPSGDLVATADAFSVKVGTTTTLNVLANDTGSFAATNPVTISVQPSTGTATAVPAGSVTFVAPAAAQAVTFTYSLTGSNGAVSEPATVTVTVTT